MKKNELFQYLCREWKECRMCRYGVEYSSVAKEVVHNGDTLLTSDEHSRMSELDFKDYFSNLKSLKRWYFSYLDNFNKLAGIPVIGEAVRGGDCRNILSFGSGPSVLEFYLKDMFQDKINVIVTDYDKFIMDRVRVLMPEITAMTFDFYADDPMGIIKENDIDTVIMFGAACSMDDETYINFLRSIAHTGVKNIFTFEGGIYGWLEYQSTPIIRILKSTGRYLFKRAAYEKWKKNFGHLTCFHAYARTENKLKRIYRTAGWEYKRVKRDVPWKCAYRLTRL